jgi:uncharacterized membrane protein YbhN (UPF0104 family)
MPKRRLVFFLLKLLLAMALLAAVGWKFAEFFKSVNWDSLTKQVDYVSLAAAGLLYIGCHTLWGTFWVQLLRGQGVTITWWLGLRAYFVSQFGKYVPGKAWVIFLRVGLLRSLEVRPTVVIVTGAYETLTNMAAGAVLGAVLLPWSGLTESLNTYQQYGLFGLALLPLALLGLNRLVRRVAKKYAHGAVIPTPSVLLLARGLVQAIFGWAMLGLSLWFVVNGVNPDPVPLTLPLYAQYLCGVAVSYVFGFLVLFSPAGAGAREWVLQLMLARQLASDPLAALISVLLRIVWTLFEVVVAIGLYFGVRIAKPNSSEPEA